MVMKVHVIYNDDEGVVEGFSYDLPEDYTYKNIEDYIYVVCDEHITYFQWFSDKKNYVGSCVIKKESL